jgi:8-oxo-dGTP pyrophosphatase MutT (NUDIX family)
MPQNEIPVAEPRHASTVLVARDASDTDAPALQILLTQRHASLRFMGGAYVFPGGTLQASDSDAGLASACGAPLAWPSQSDAPLDIAHALAAIRETFEEAGLLLGAPELEAGALALLRRRLLDGEDFGMLLATARIALDLSAVVPFMHWVTPLAEPRRFDTRFYVAKAPEQQRAEIDARETIDLIWRAPSTAVAEAQSGSLVLSPPTLRTLQQIEHVNTVAALLTLARASRAPRVEPIIRIIAGARTIIFPGDPEHPVREQLLKGATRIRF